MKFRLLRAEEIDVRVSTVKENGMSLLLYKDARVDQNILDETVGAENWQRSHELIGNNLYCTVSIYDKDKNMWISKQDVGTESKTEAEKGQASDSFKRACFNWGIGRELYTAPFIWVNTGKGIDKYTKFKVTDIGYDADGNINQLSIATNKGQSVFNLYNITRKDMLAEVCAKYPEGSANRDALLNAFGIKKIEDATDEQLQAAYNKVHK